MTVSPATDSSMSAVMLDVDVSHHDVAGHTVCVIAPHGEIDASKAPAMTARFNELLGAGQQNFVIDLAGVTFIDSSGISSIVHLFKRVRIGHGDVKLAAVRPEVLKVLTLIRLDRVFEIHIDVATARESYGS
jgi:anti-sigma B factor antagonist